MMNNNLQKIRAIAILGMHRSGTSAITRGLNILGVYIGEDEDLIPPYPENPEGFWERWDIYHLEEALLAALKRRWDTVMPLPEGWQNAAEVLSFRTELIALIRQNFSDASLWGWKDPRSTLLFELWKDVLIELYIQLAVVFVVRNPLDVARSLEKRNGIPSDRGMGIWFNYNITALRAVAQLPTAFLSYDRFLSSWESELRRCADTLDLDWPQDDGALRSTMNSFIRPELRHSCSALEDLVRAGAPQPVVKLYELLVGLLDGSAGTESIRREVNVLYDEFFSYSRFFHHDIDDSWDVKTELVSANTRLMECNNLIHEFGRRPADTGDGPLETVGDNWSIMKLLRKLFKVN